MVDFGVLAAVRDLCQQEQVGLEYGLSANNIFVLPPERLPQKGPAIILELEEVWNQKVRFKMESGRVVFKLSLYSNTQDGSEVIDLANTVRQLLEKGTFPLSSTHEVSFRMNSSILDFKKSEELPRKVEQRYEAFVRRQQNVAKTT
jgi:hypothetical protein